MQPSQVYINVKVYHSMPIPLRGLKGNKVSKNSVIIPQWKGLLSKNNSVFK